jgi:hypothetical protein
MEGDDADEWVEPPSHRVAAGVEILAPIEDVWALVCQLRRYDEWVESTIEVRSADEVAGMGARWQERSRISGVWLATIEWRVTEFVAPTRIAFEGTGVAMVRRLGFSIDLEAVAAGTHCELTLWYSPRFGPIGFLLDLLTRSNVTNDQKRTVRSLAFLAEGRTGTPPPT